ncbi:unnamed protein product [Tetraodon nigroviridis]|uniref:(spotted green pufferfish) hypothetical protein n=1 Tax=Tetraodon nigroviridis TaxID=99883 RepID=Q4RAV7_TETNG|nr:unnamed protein product [Tetraodon nigroviridis]
MGGCKDDSENSPDSCKNGQVQIMKGPNMSQGGHQSGSLRHGTTTCLPGARAPPFLPSCQQACQQAFYHSLPLSNHNQGTEHGHALSHMHEQKPTVNDSHNHAHNHSHAHNHNGSHSVCLL